MYCSKSHRAQAAEGLRELVEAVSPEEWLLLEGGAAADTEANADGVPSAHRFCATLGPPPPDAETHEGVRLLFRVLAGLMPAGTPHPTAAASRSAPTCRPPPGPRSPSDGEGACGVPTRARPSSPYAAQGLCAARAARVL